MLPSWMIERMARERREREERMERERARLWIELPVDENPRERSETPAGSGVIRIEIAC
jgi:hypothetical protein